MSARKIGFLILLLGFGAAVETAWQVRGDWRIGPEGCRVIGGRFYGPSYSFEQAAERALPAGEAPRLEVRNAFGGVSVTAGAPGVVKVKLRKVVFRPTEEKAQAFAERIELRLSGDGALVKVGTNRDEIGRGQDVGFETHIEIEAPAETAVEIRSEHGRVDLAGVASADVVSSFDGVSVGRLAGALKLESRNGEVRASGIGAGLELTARHGNVEVSDVTGPSKLDVEHGDLSARKTGPLDVAIQYGGFDAEGVAGDLVVRGGHAGVRASDVTGRAEVETSYEGIHLARVGGDVRAKAEHGEVTAEDVAGSLFAETSHEGVKLDRVDGPVQVVADRGGVEASGLAKGATVRTTGGDVSLDGFTGRVEVEVERGSARLSPRAPLAADVTVSATQGEVRLEVPEGSRFDLDAESRRGELSTEVPGLTTSQTDGEPGRAHRVAGQLAGGGVVVRLRADGDVTLEAKPAGPIADRSVAKPTAAAPAEATPTPAATLSPAATPKPPAAPAEAAPPPPVPPEKPEAPETP
ncbi:MAG TPA: DUF4097 family beta strand repeat-containing protein [Vicinamibacteria bacterium]|nr:DUF4097 family beta strand repeat-containing protein [Vicinamibacteria bacterium]